jgi:hypothetical protein
LPSGRDGLQPWKMLVGLHGGQAWMGVGCCGGDALAALCQGRFNQWVGAARGRQPRQCGVAPRNELVGVLAEEGPRPWLG